MLRFTPFERYMFEDDRDAHPMSFFFRVQVRHQLCLSCLRAAVNKLGAIHPLFFATVVQQRGKPYWKLGTAAPTVTQHQYGKFCSSRDDWGFDLSSESGLRISHAASDRDGEIWFQIHHCCSDGRGVLDFLHDALELYQKTHATNCVRCHDRSDSICQPNSRGDALSEVVSRKTGFSSSFRQYLWPWSKHWYRIWHYYLHKSRPLVASVPNVKSAVKSFRPAYVTQRIPFSVSKWRSRKEADQPTFNDGLLQATFRALCRRVQQDPQRATGWLRIAVPIDQRISHGHSDVALNRSSMVFLDRHTKQIMKDSLLASLTSEMRIISNLQMSSVLQDLFQCLDRIPGAMKAVTHDQRCAVTTVVSNLGKLNDGLAGIDSRDESDLRPILGDELDVLVPLRPGTHVSFGVVTYRDHIHLCLHYDARLVREEEAITILNDTCRELSAFCRGDNLAEKQRC